MIKLTDTPNTSTVSVLVRAPTEHVVAEIKRAFDDAIGVVSIAHEDNSVLPGGGAPYMQLSSSLRICSNGWWSRANGCRSIC